MTAATPLQKSADDLERLNGMAFLAQSLQAGEVGGHSTGPAVLNLGDPGDAWVRFLNHLEDTHGREVASAVDMAGSAYMAAESQRSFLRGLTHGRAFGEGELLDNELVEATVDALIAQAPERG